MPRKGHKKSRHGCVECKKRHVKCDETPGPTCVNCKTANLKCSYGSQPRAAPKSTTLSPPTDPSLTRSHSGSIEPDFNRNVISSISSTSDVHTPPPHPVTPPLVNLMHLELFHNFSTEAYKSFILDDCLAVQYRQTAISNGLKYPFLMHELLAFSALHLSIHRPEQSAIYREQASALQSSAVQGCKHVLGNINDENCVSIFLFTSLIGMHAFCDAFTHRDGDFNSFLDKLTGSISLLRGVRMVSSQCWETLKTSELSEIVNAGHLFYKTSLEGKQECQPLIELVRTADVSETSLHAYENAITELQRIFDAELHIKNRGTVGLLFAWLVTSDAVYTNLLTQRRPEALIILAYYAVILHHRRASWAVQDAGHFLINAITQYLGSHWARWLEWPNSIVNESAAQLWSLP